MHENRSARTALRKPLARIPLLVLAVTVLLIGSTGAGQASAASSTTSAPRSTDAAPAAVAETAEFGATPSPAPATSSQLITVNSPTAGSSYAMLSAWQRGAGGNWIRAFGPVTARVGATGIGHASEGSSYTPKGTFPLTVAFGRLANPGTKMPYFQTDPADWWDENPSSPTYNLHVRRTSSPGGASENLYYSGTAYNYAANIGYNLGRVPGAGSAFFLHVNTGDSTAGCVSIDQGTLAAMLRWLNPALHPYIDIRVGGALTPAPTLTAARAGKAVRTLYWTILGRTPEPQVQASLAGQLMRGGTVRSIADHLTGSVEYDRRVAVTVFRRCLGRDPGIATSYTNWLRAGGTLSGLYARLCGSTESWLKAGKNAGRWLATVYPAALGRAPTSASAVWLPVLARSGPAAAMAGIATSAEFGRHQLGLIYLAMLGRGPTQPAFNAYSGSMSKRGIFLMPSIISAGNEFWGFSQG